MKKATKQQRAAREKANPFRRGIPPSEEAMKLLLDELAKARAIYDGREKMLYGEGAAARRAGAFFAVNAVEMFLRDSRVRAHDLQPLIDISAAFTDHSRGKPNSLFASMKKGGGGTHWQIGAFRARVAATVTLLIKTGDKKKAAVARVADALTEAGIPGVTAKQVDSWHREISSERFGDRAAIQLYKSQLAKRVSYNPTDPRLAAQCMLVSLPDFAPPREL